MNESIEVLRFEIEGQWTAAEMGRMLIHTEELYNLRLVLEVMREDWRDWEHFYMEAMHFPPFRRRMKRYPFDPAMSFLPSAPLTLPADSRQMTALVQPHERLQVRRK